MSGPTVKWKVSFGGSSRPRRQRIDAPAPPTPVEAPPAKAKPNAGRKPGDAADRLARQLALAHYVEDQIARGVLRDHAHAAQVLGVSRPRVSQITTLLGLSPVLQERVLVGAIACSERELRRVAAEPLWPEQTRMVEALAQRTNPQAAGAAADEQVHREEPT